MNIAICDKNNGERIKNEALRFMKEKNIESHCVIFKEAVDLLVSSEVFDIVILYANFSEINSVQISDYLKRYNNELAIIFAADDYSYLNDAFDIEARRYLISPIDEALPSALESAIDYLNAKTTQCYLENSGAITRVSKSSIIYLEISGRKTKIVTKNSCYYSKLKMQDFQKSLNPAQFASPHKSFYVNLGEITEYRRFGGQYYLCMSDNKFIPITRTRKPDFEKAYIQHIKRNNLM